MLKRNLSLGILFLFLSFSILALSDEVVLQPGPIDGVDAWFTDIFDYGSNYGVDDYRLQVGGWFDNYHSSIWFDLSTAPLVATKATLWFYCIPKTGKNASKSNVGMYLDYVTSPWDENTGWYSKPPATQVGVLPAPILNNWYAIDLTDLYNQWQAGTLINYGIQLRPTSVANQWNNFASSDYSDPSLRPMLVVEYESEPELKGLRLTFPLPDYSPYTVPVTAVFDNDGLKNGQVVAYNGEVGSVNPWVYSKGVIGYEKVDGSDFTLELLSQYDDQLSDSGKKVLFYDGHRGYDYGVLIGTPIVAPADGKLALATNRIAPNRRNWEWRNNRLCPVPRDVNTKIEWSRYHTIFIVHPPDELGDTYSTWSSHIDSLEKNVRLQIGMQGYANVVRGQVIGYTGKFGTAGPHLHFGVRRNGNLIDPYGTGTTESTYGNAIWNEHPPVVPM
jgi:murein DD-endopeptidase MepM/ murein hydrolase activator NlpD